MDYSAYVKAIYGFCLKMYPFQYHLKMKIMLPLWLYAGKHKNATE